MVHTCLEELVKMKKNMMAPDIIGSLVVQDVKYINPKIGGKGIITLMKVRYGMDIWIYLIGKHTVQ